MSSHFTDFNSDYPCTHTHSLTHSAGDWFDSWGARFQGFALASSVSQCSNSAAYRLLHCLIKIRGNGLSDFIGRLCRFPPVSRRKGSMTSQSDTQWVTVYLPLVPPSSPQTTLFSLPPPLRQTSQLSHECKASSFAALLLLEPCEALILQWCYFSQTVTRSVLWLLPERFAGTQCSCAVCCAPLLLVPRGACSLRLTGIYCV